MIKKFPDFRKNVFNFFLQILKKRYKIFVSVRYISKLIFYIQVVYMYHASLVLTLYILVLVFITGTVFGSFIDCMAWRIVKGERVLRGRSHCDVCKKELGAEDLIPVVSYFMSGGKCRHCGSKISPESTYVELFLGVVFVIITLKHDLSFEAMRYMGLAVILAGLSLVDLKTYTIPDRFHVAGILWWLLTLPLIVITKGIGVTEMYSAAYMSSKVAGIYEEAAAPDILGIMGKDLITALISGGSIAVMMLVISLIFDKLTGKESLGGGDIKLLFMTGLYMQPVLTYCNLVLSCIVGLVFAGILKKEKIPFGPAISLATIISMVFGSGFIIWYTSLLT